MARVRQMYSFVCSNYSFVCSFILLFVPPHALDASVAISKKKRPRTSLDEGADEGASAGGTRAAERASDLSRARREHGTAAAQWGTASTVALERALKKACTAARQIEKDADEVKDDQQCAAVTAMLCVGWRASKRARASVDPLSALGPCGAPPPPSRSLAPCWLGQRALFVRLPPRSHALVCLLRAPGIRT